MIKVDFLFMIFVNEERAFTELHKDYEANDVFMECTDGSSLDESISNRYRDLLSLQYKSYRFDCSKLYIGEPPLNNMHYAENLHEIKLESSVMNIVDKANQLFPSAQKPFVVLKLFYLE